jgi:hypothetical protein
MTIVGYLTYPLAEKVLIFFAVRVALAPSPSVLLTALDAWTEAIDVVCVCVCAWQGVKSFRAIQSPDPKDDKQWLTFWLLFGLFDLVRYHKRPPAAVCVQI